VILASASLIRETTTKQKVIAGVVFELGRPVSREVRAYSRATGCLLAKRKSNTDGAYKLYLPLDASYSIIAFDYNRVFNAVIQDNVVPK